MFIEKSGKLKISLVISLVSGFFLLFIVVETKANGIPNEAPLEGTIPMSGDIGNYVEGEIDDPVHDPSIFKDKDTYYVVSTGRAQTPSDPGGIYVRKSSGNIGGPWEAIGEIPVPSWTREYNANHLWAPHVVKNGNTFYLYYTVSQFGTNQSAIGAAKTESPADVDSWEDLGPVLTSAPGRVDYNAIDPMVLKDKGKWWMVFGSHFSGIKLVELNNMTEPIGEIHNLASREETTEHNPIEGPTIFKKGRYYYLLTSWDTCCNGVDSTYKVAVGRSESITGPYVDKDGNSLLEDGGDIILSNRGTQIGPGGQDILKDRGRYYMINHYYDGDANGIIRMQVRSMTWDNHWPFFARD